MEKGYFQLTSLSGKLLIEGKIHSTTVEIDLSDFQSGVYMLTLFINGVAETWKIIKKADVTAMGAATYSIPIEVVPGTQGVQPNLSVIYNSMAGTGLLGTHWDLDGLSAITRVGQNMFLDLRSTSVSMDYSDRFALDGNRLVCYDPNLYGRSGTLYQPEFEDFSKIYSYGTLGDGPEYFKVYQDDGSVVEYGNTAESRQRVGNGVYSWYVNKIADINGNYMTFTYGNDGSEIWIDHIDYTGNESAGLVPYARVTFTYSDISHVGSFFVAGREISQTRLLRAITVQYKNGISYEMVRQYLFEYTEVFPMRLTSVRLKGSDGSELNPTAVEWTESLYNDNLNNTLFTIQNFNGGNGHLAVDFNRDGVCDIIEYSLNYWTPFFKQGNVIVPGNQNYSTSTSWNIKNCLPADIDGDGFSEIVTVCQTYYDNNILVDVTNQAMQTNHNDGYDDLMTFYSVSGGDMKAIGYLCCGYYDNKVYFQNPFPAFSSPVILTSSELNDHYNFTFGDFNNDHHVDLVASKSVNSLYDGILLCEFKMEKRVPQVKKVTAGDGSFVKWRYQDIFGLFYRYASHISILPYQYNVVESMINSLGTSIQTNTHQYFFDHPTYSFKRKQRMGFLTTSSMDVNSQITDSVFYQVVTGENALSQDFIMPVFKKTYVSHQLYKSLGFQTACLTFNNNKRRFPYILKTTDTNHLNQTLITNIDLRLPTGRPIVTQKTVQNESDFYPQFSERLNYKQTTHNIPSGGFVTLADSAFIKALVRHLASIGHSLRPQAASFLL